MTVGVLARRIVLDRSVHRFDRGRVLLGGSPMRLVRLSAAGARLLAGWVEGGSIGADEGSARLLRRLLDSGLVHPVAAPGSRSPDEVTLVVPVKDNPAGLARLLAATTEFAHRVIVDDGSADAVPTATIRHPRPLGPAAARNAGWRRATTEFVAFVDSDVVPRPGWLDSALALFDDPRVAAVAPRVTSPPGTAAPTSVAAYEASHSSLDMGAEPAVVRPLSRVGYVPTAALIVRRAALAELGGFDERLRFGEDVDVVWRLTDAGHLVRYHPAAVVTHRPRATLGSWLRQRYDYGTSAAPLARRHPGRLACARVSAWHALSWGALVVALGPARPDRAARGLRRAARSPVLRGSAVVVPALVATALPARRLRGRGVPTAAALAVGAGGHLAAGLALADAVRRTWWPVLMGTRLGRRLVLLSLLPCLVEALRGRRGPAWFAMRLADQAAYSLGVWAGCLRARTAAPLLPDLRVGTGARPGRAAPSTPPRASASRPRVDRPAQAAS